MSAVCDNYLAAFAIFLNATAQQIAWITAFPQLFGAISQFLSVWIGRRGVSKVRLIVGGAAFQCATIGVFILLCASEFTHAVTILIVTVVLFQAGSHFVQPQWRTVMVALVPVERRGRYFARRSRITALASFAALSIGGLLLHFAAQLGYTAAGFAILFGCALVGRLKSIELLATLPDVAAPSPAGQNIVSLRAAVKVILGTLGDRQYRRFMLFVASMQGSVAIAAPFFSIHMLRNLNFSYAELMANLGASIVIQLITINSWGTIADHLGNRIILVITAFLIPTLPALWIFSDNFWYLIAVQCVAGLAWGGFNLSSSNYLFDLRPVGSELATFSAVLAVTSAVAIFCGALLGGFVAANLPGTLDLGGMNVSFTNTIYGVFALSSICRFAVALWFTPRVAEIRLSENATVNQVIYRLGRFNQVTGVVMDIVGAVRRRRD
ncbi:MAG: MFS family permease [Gammaproteobacteria bacterium]|jgi:MFS family permease